MALSKNGVAVKSEGQLVVAGTKGYVLAPSPWWLTRRFEVHFEDSSKIEVYEPVFQGDGFRYEISDFVSKINGIDKNGYKLTAEEAIAMAEVTEAYMKQKKIPLSLQIFLALGRASRSAWRPTFLPTTCGRWSMRS